MFVAGRDLRSMLPLFLLMEKQNWLILIFFFFAETVAVVVAVIVGSIPGPCSLSALTGCSFREQMHVFCVCTAGQKSADALSFF